MARTEGYPSLTAREHWGRYALGTFAEVGFIVGLTAVALALAVLAAWIW